MTDHLRHHRAAFVRAEDGTALSYEVYPCEDGPTLLFCNGLATTAFYWKHILARFEGRAQLITWDYRGHGRSQAARDLDALTIPACARDIGKLLDVAGVERAALLGFSVGCQVVLEAWRHLPERILALVPALGTFEHPFDNVFHPRIGPQLFRAYRRLAPALAPAMMPLAALGARTPLTVRAGQLGGMIERNIPDEEMLPFFEHFSQLDGQSWAAMAIAAQAHSARDLFPHITAPTLVVSGGRDTWTPAHMSETMRDEIPGAQLAHFPDATHTGLLGHHQQIGDAIEAFLVAHDLIAPRA